MRSLVAEVLAGRGNVREVFSTPEFNDTLEHRLGNIQQGLDTLSDEERVQLFDANRETTPPERLAAMRDAYDPEPETTAEPDTPSEEDEDAFFENFSVFDNPR